MINLKKYQLSRLKIFEVIFTWKDFIKKKLNLLYYLPFEWLNWKIVIKNIVEKETV